MEFLFLSLYSLSIFYYKTTILMYYTYFFKYKNSTTFLFLSVTSLVQAITIFHLDYWNSLLSGLLAYILAFLQSIFNIVARILLKYNILSYCFVPNFQWFPISLKSYHDLQRPMWTLPSPSHYFSGLIFPSLSCLFCFKSTGLFAIPQTDQILSSLRAFALTLYSSWNAPHPDICMFSSFL